MSGSTAANSALMQVTSGSECHQGCSLKLMCYADTEGQFQTGSNAQGETAEMYPSMIFEC